jgi:F420-dependent oxidoreductase-like protein
VRLRVTVEPQRGASYERILGVARAAEACGFDGFFRSDHYLQNHGQEPVPPGPTDAWVTLAGLARETERIRLGTLVSPVTFRHPGTFAVAVAQVDAMSGGRLELGLGTGWFENEHRSLGIPFPPFAERVERLEDLLELLDMWWSTPADEPFDFKGRHIELPGCLGLPKPAQPRIPVILGSNGPKVGPRLVAGRTDEFNRPFGTPGECAEQFARVTAACDERGVRHPTRWSTVLTLACGQTWDEAVRRASNAGWLPERMSALPGRVIGTPEQVVDELSAYAAVGVDTIYLQILDMDDHDHLDLIAREVAPKLP